MVRNIYTCIVGVGVGGKSMRGKSWQLMATVAGGVMGILTNQAAYPQSRPYLHTQQYVWILRLFTQHRQDTSFKPHMSFNLQEKFYNVYNQSQSTFQVIFCAMLYLVFECSWQAACHV